MSRHPLSLLLVALATALCLRATPTIAQVGRGKILGRSLLAQKDLQRAWTAQVQLDPARDRVTSLLLDRGWLFAQTELGVVQALDGETGATIWSEQIGDPRYPTSPLAVNDRFVVVINGTTFYLLERHNGRSVLSKEIEGVPNASPAISPGRVYIPTMRGLIESWQLPLDEATSTELERQRQRTQTVWRIHSAGRSPTPLLVTPHSVCWPTDTGYLYAAELDARKVLYRVEMSDRIVAPLGYRSPTLVAGSLGGFVWAVNETDGKVLWRFSTGYPIRKGLVIVADRIYACPQHAGMFCIDSERGTQQWWVSDAANFLAVSTTKVYASDRSKRMLILDAKTGNLLTTVATEGLPLQLVNQQTDRIYLGTPRGLLQCLHELGQPQPIEHVPPPAEKEQPEKKPTKEQPASQAGPATADQPTAGGAAPAANPAPPAAKQPNPPPPAAPASTPTPDRNPFGDG